MKKEKPKPIHRELLVKSKRHTNVNDASWPKHSKQAKSNPKQEFHNQNWQLNNSPLTMWFPFHGSHIPMPCGAYCSMLYSCPSWYYNLCMPSLPRYLYPDYITYREPAICKPSPTINDRFDEKERSMKKKKYKVIKQVYRIKKGG